MVLATCACWSLLLSASPQEDSNQLVVNVLADGTIKILGRVFFKPNPAKPQEQDTKKLAALFEARRLKDLDARYSILIRAARTTPFQYIQLVMMTAANVGGVTQILFGALREDETEGKLLSQLPIDKGLSPDPHVDLQDVRIVL